MILGHGNLVVLDERQQRTPHQRQRRLRIVLRQVGIGEPDVRPVVEVARTHPARGEVRAKLPVVG